MIPNDIEAKSGDKILPKFRKLVQWIDAQRLASTDSRVLINTTQNGTFVSMIDQAPSIITPLSIRLNGDRLFSCSEGYINGKLPRIKPRDGELQDIVDADGLVAPPAKLTDLRPIFICAKVIFDSFYKLKSSEIIWERPEKILRGGSANYASADKTITGLIPLAYLRKTRLVKFVSHNLQARAFLHNGSYRIIYWPA